MTNGGFKVNRPTELVDLLAYIQVYAPDDYPVEDDVTNAGAFSEAFSALEHFAASAAAEEGREAVLQVLRHLRVAYELFERNDALRASKLVQETEELFQRSRRFIRVSDE